MTNRIAILRRNIGLSSASYCAVCFAVTSALYLFVVMTGNADIRDPKSGAAAAVIFPLYTLLVSSLFVGLVTTLFCLVGLAGVWILATDSRRRGVHHVLGGALIAAIVSGVFTLGSSLGNDHLVLRGCAVGAISLTIALVVRVYTSRTTMENATHA